MTRKAWDGLDCGQGEEVDIETAIALYTREAARVAGIPELGQLKAGFHADFAVLSEDLLEVDNDRIDQVYVLRPTPTARRCTIKRLKAVQYALLE